MYSSQPQTFAFLLLFLIVFTSTVCKPKQLLIISFNIFTLRFYYNSNPVRFPNRTKHKVPECSESTQIHCICLGTRSPASHCARTAEVQRWTCTCTHTTHGVSLKQRPCRSRYVFFLKRRIPSWSYWQVLAQIFHNLSGPVIPETLRSPGERQRCQTLVPNLQ